MSKRFFILYIICCLSKTSLSQVWDGSNTSTTTGDNSNTSIQLTHNPWGGHHGILFNSYRKPVLNDGDFVVANNILYKYNTNPWASGAGAILFLANGGKMDFLISEPSSGADQPVNWGISKLTILRNGNIGMGTENPGGKRLYVKANSDGDHMAVIENTSTSGFGLVVSAALDPIRVGPAGTYDGRYLIVNTQGNVGIGTSAPDAKLAVNGTIHSKEVKVDLNNWPDYVFNTDYKLPSLLEVESYIKANKHLPEIPSEAEVNENGVNLGEMNALLLKKVEQLTLYVIELKKENTEIEQLRKRIELLEKK